MYVQVHRSYKIASAMTLPRIYLYSHSHMHVCALCPGNDSQRNRHKRAARGRARDLLAKQNIVVNIFHWRCASFRSVSTEMKIVYVYLIGCRFCKLLPLFFT